MTTALLLGAAVWQSGPSPSLRRRADHAVRLYRDGRVDRVLCCGGMGKHPPTEAEALRGLLLQAGLPEAAILVESASRNTRENIANAIALIGTAQPVIIVTDGYHAPRARLIARRLGLAAQSATPPPPGLTMQRARMTAREAPALMWHILTFWPRRRKQPPLPPR